MEVAVVILLTVVFPLAVMFPFIPEFFSEHMETVKNKRRNMSERHLPLYERLARAEERKAEKSMDRGWLTDARKHFREAQKIRREATDAMIRGEEPTL